MGAHEASHVAVFTCCHVLEGRDVLFVSHDADGDWQFLCGAAAHDPSEGRVVGRSHLVERDPSLEELGSMCTNHHAERNSRGAAWTVVDDHEGFIRRCVADHGWAVQLIPAHGDAPAFAYTVGLFRNYGQAELIVLGLRLALMHSMLNTLGERMKAGETLRPEDRQQGVIAGFDVTLREVRARASFEEHVGYALWFYERAPFPLFQVVWPDREGRFPDDPGAGDGLQRQQPLLP